MRRISDYDAEAITEALTGAAEEEQEKAETQRPTDAGADTVVTRDPPGRAAAPGAVDTAATDHAKEESRHAESAGAR